MSTTFRARLWASVVLCGLAFTTQAIAQSSYTMTVLNKPTGANGVLPLALDEAGNAHGGATFPAGYVFTNGGIGSCWICPQFSQRQVSWAAGSAASATGTAGLKGFVTVGVGDAGTLVGGYEPRNQGNVLSQPTSSATPLAIPNTAFQQMRYVAGSGVAVVRQGALSPLGLPPEAMLQMSYPYAFEVTAIGYNDTMLVNRTGTDDTQPAAPFTWRNGQYTALDTSVAAAGESLFADAINAQGLIVGHTAVTFGGLGQFKPETVNPVRWTLGGLAERLPGNGLTGYLPVAVNQPGQVLLQKATGYVVGRGNFTQAAVWFNGSKTDIVSPLGQPTYGTAINDSGTVIGCVAPLSSATSDTPFIWRNGLLQNLETYVTARGIKLPTGTKLGCPRAINNAGSILTFYYKTSSPGTWTWVRLNAKP